jgi:hypothetical protein
MVRIIRNVPEPTAVFLIKTEIRFCLLPKTWFSQLQLLPVTPTIFGLLFSSKNLTKKKSEVVSLTEKISLTPTSRAKSDKGFLAFFKRFFLKTFLTQINFLFQ